MNIYVGNLSYDMTDSELKELFSEFGAVTSAKVITDRETGKAKGFGFVEMIDKDEAEKDCYGNEYIVQYKDLNKKHKLKIAEQVIKQLKN